MFILNFFLYKYIIYIIMGSSPSYGYVCPNGRAHNGSTRYHNYYHCKTCYNG